MDDPSEQSIPTWLWVVGIGGVACLVLPGLLLLGVIAAQRMVVPAMMPQPTVPPRYPANPVMPGTIATGWIVFASDRDGNMEIYVMEADGSSTARLTNDPEADLSPAWSPDGTQIAFASRRSGEMHIHVMDEAGANVTQVTTEGGNNIAPAWSPDGTQIVFSGLGDDGLQHLYRIDADGANLTEITSGGDDIDPDWSPDGAWIVFARDAGSGYDLYVLEVATGAVSQLTSDSDTERDPAWSPDGTQIAYVEESGGTGTLMIMDADGQNATSVAGMGWLDVSSPSWSADGLFLTFGGADPTESNIHIVEIATGRTWAITPYGMGTEILPDWEP